MSLAFETDRARNVAKVLHSAFNDTPTGIFGYTTMPEDIVPPGMERGSYEHRLFITLTVSIDYMRDAEALWAVSRRAYENEQTRYLFDPARLAAVQPEVVVRDLQRSGVAQRPRQDGNIWRTVALTFLEEWQGDPINLVKAAAYDAPTLLRTVRGESGFPFLRGPKISALWVRMMRDNVGLDLKNMDKMPIPTDVHIVRATFATGVLKGRFRGTLDQARPYVVDVWAEALRGEELAPVDIDEPLWHLSRYGCTRRNLKGCPVKAGCPVGSYCVKGVVAVSAEGLEVDT